MEKEFDFEKYIWQIQFRPRFMFPENRSFCATVDYLNRRLIFSESNTDSHSTDEVIFSIDDDKRFAELLSYSEISKIRQFEAIPGKELWKQAYAYRDGWRMEYYYFMRGVPPRVDGRLGPICKENPLEEILQWIRRNVPQDNPWWMQNILTV